MSGRRKLWTIVSSLIVLTAVGAGLLYARAGSVSALAEYRVADLSCGACVQKIDKALQRLPGVGKVAVDVRGGRAHVQYDPSEIDPGQIRNAIMVAGFPAFLVKTSKVESSGDPGAIGAPAGAGGGSGCGCCERK